MQEEFDMFWTPSTEEESVEIDLIDLSTKNVVFPSEPSSPTESDESDDSKTIQNSPEQIPSWETKPSPSTLSSNSLNVTSLSGNPLSSSGVVPSVGCMSHLSHPQSGTRSYHDILSRVTVPSEPLSNIPFQFNPNTFVPQNMDPVSQYFLNQYLYQQLIAFSRVNSMNGAATAGSLNTGVSSSNLGRNLLYNPLARMPVLPVPFSNPMQMSVQLSLPFQCPFFSMPMDFSMMNQSPLMNQGQSALSNASLVSTRGIRRRRHAEDDALAS
jgi:hypothetical protein